MNYKKIPMFKGLVTNYHDRIVPDDHLIDCQNVIFDEGKVKTREGFGEYGDNVPVGDVDVTHCDDMVKIIHCKHIRDEYNRDIAFSRFDTWAHDGSDWYLKTLHYEEGQCSCAGGIVVTGVGTNWAQIWSRSGASAYNEPYKYVYIKFSATVEGVGTWYRVFNIVDTTNLVLPAVGPNTGGNVDYCLRFCRNLLNAIDDTCVIGDDFSEDPAGTDDNENESIPIVTDGYNFIRKIGGIRDIDYLWEKEAGKSGVAELVIPDIWAADHTMVRMPYTYVRDEDFGLCFGLFIHGIDVTATNVPQNMWGCFGFEMNPKDQTIDSLDSPNNVVGYDSEPEAILDWPDASADHHRLCYVTVYNVNVGGWTGRDHNFDDAGVTSKFWSAYSPNIVNRARYVEYYNDKLFLGNIIDTGEKFSQTIQCSVTQDYEDFSGDGSALVDLILSQGEIAGFKQLRNKLFVYKTDSICMAETTGNYLDPIRTTEGIARDIGLASINAVIDVGTFHIFLTRDNVYIFDGINLQAVGDDVKNDIIDNISMEFIGSSFAYNVKSQSLYVLSIAHGEWYCRKAYVFDYKKKKWSHWYWGKELCAGNVYYEDNEPVVLLGGTAGYIYKTDDAEVQDEDVDISSYMITKDYTLNEPEKLFKLLKLLTDLKVGVAGDIRITASTDYGITWTDNHDITMDSSITHITNFFRRGRTVRIKIENLSNSRFEIESLNIGFTASGYEKDA